MMDNNEKMIVPKHPLIGCSKCEFYLHEAVKRMEESNKLYEENERLRKENEELKKTLNINENK